MNGNVPVVPVPPRIRILLIDDKPEGLWNEREPSLPPHPGLPEELRASFELRWIGTAGEAREYIDLTRMIGRHNPGALDGAGTVPEIVVIDYSLTQDPRTVEQRLRQNAPELWKELSPIEPLRRIAVSMGLPLPHKGEQYEVELKVDGPTTTDKEGENYGCFVGGLIISTFTDHPCAPVTVTVRQPEQLRGTHTGFFQWLMLAESSGKLRAVGRSGINWKRVADQGVDLLRKRIGELARVRAISLSFHEMIKLAREEKISTITVASKYGMRSLPLAGLFCDKPKDQIFVEAKLWVAGNATNGKNRPSGLLEQLADRKHFAELTDAEVLAERLWETYKNRDQVQARLELATMVREIAAGHSFDRDRLGELWRRFSTTPCDPAAFQAKVKKGQGSKKKRVSVDLDKGTDIRIGAHTDMSRRWACLMVLVRLLKFRADALVHLQESDEFDDSTDWVVGLMRAPLRSRDLYLALFPAARNPIDLKDLTGWQHTLERWNPPLRIEDLLPDPPDEEHCLAENKSSSSSVSANDRQFMEWYALSHHFPDAQWDNHAKRIIRGVA